MRRWALVWIVGWMVASASWAQDPSPLDAARQLWQLLDYVAVDYGGAVEGGRVSSESEYAEMREFVGTAAKQAKALPPQAGQAALMRAVSELQAAVLAKADPNDVAAKAHEAARLLLAAYPIPVAPKATPDLQRGASVYQAQCMSCHGQAGAGDGPLAAKLEPKPIAFTDAQRARTRSVMALYQVLSQGVPGTSMASFAGLPDDDRWALAFYIGTLSHEKAAQERGARLWADASAKARFPDLAAVTTLTEQSLPLPADTARDLMAYVRSNPNVVQSGTPAGLALTRTRLQESRDALARGDTASATRLALSAYLDGFEPLEPRLAARNPALLTEVEKGMLAYRSAVAANQSTDADRLASELDRSFARVEAELDGAHADPATTFVGALTILLREGLEALLIVVAMIAFLKKAQRPDALVYVHAGWLGALVAGGVTWLIATYVIGVSGASREVTEGLSSLFAAIVLLSVGLWMHQKSTAGRWQAYLKDKLSSAMSKRSAWALFALAFIAVYREVFETVLFYSALAVDDNHAALVAGLGLGVAILGLVGWLLLRTSARMPIGRFFSASSVLVAVLAVVLVGKGVAALQEAGWLSANALAWPRIPMLGMYPSAETALAQLVVLVVALAGFGFNAFTSRKAVAA